MVEAPDFIPDTTSHAPDFIPDARHSAAPDFIPDAPKAAATPAVRAPIAPTANRFTNPNMRPIELPAQPTPVGSGFGTNTPSPMTHLNDSGTAEAGNIVGGGAKAILEGGAHLAQGAESIAAMVPGGPNTPRLLTPQRVRSFNQGVEKAIPTEPGVGESAGRFVGGLALGMGAGALDPAVVPAVFGGMGAAGGVASAEDDAMQARERGVQVSPLREGLAKVTGGAVGGIGGYASAELMGAAGREASMGERVLNQAGAGGAQTMFGNVEKNVVGKIVDPSQPWEGATAREFIPNVGAAVGFQLAHEAGDALPQRTTSESPDFIPDKGTERVLAQSPPAGPEAPGPTPPPPTARTETANAPRAESAAGPAPQPVQGQPAAAPLRTPETAKIEPVSSQENAPKPAVKATEEIPQKAPPLPPIDSNVHPSIVQNAWKLVAADRPDVAAGIKRIEPLDDYRYPAWVNASFNPESGVLSVRLGKEMTPQTLAHEFEHVAQAQRGEAKGPGEFNTEQEFDRTIEAPARAAADKFAPKTQNAGPVEKTATDAGRGANVREEKAGALPTGVGPASPSDPAFSYPSESPIGMRNKMVDQEREARGLEPAMQAGKRAFGDVWDSAMKEIDRNPQVQDQLLDELRAKPRAVTDREDAMLLHRQVDLQSQFAGEAKALEQAQVAGDAIGIAEHRTRAAQLSNQLLDIYNVGKNVGTETGRGLNARKMMAREDFTLASMETQKRVANSGKDLTPAQQVEVKNLNKKITDTQDALDKYTARLEQQKQKGLQRQIDALDARIKAGDTSKRTGKPTVDSKVVSNLKAKRDALQEQLSALRGDQPAIDAMKRRTAGQIDKLKGKIEQGDFTTGSSKQDVKLDPEAESLKAQLERYKQQFRDGVARDRLKNRTITEKAQDTFVKWRRAFLLSSPVTIAKLTSAAGQRMAFTPVEEAIGAGIGKLIPGIAKNAPREGGFSFKAESLALTEGFTKGMRDAAQTLKTGKSDMDVLYGNKSNIPPSAIDFLGHVHGALKTPAKRAEFTRSFQKRAEFAMRNGLDTSDPMVQTRIATEAYKDANRSIFMQDNRVVTAYKRAISALKEPNPKTGKVPLGSKALATVGETLTPIVRVPTNVVAETMQYATGAVTGSARLARVIATGAKGLPPEYNDLIMRDLKKGIVGTGMMAMGYAMADKIGGYYQPGQRDKNDAKFGSVRMFGHDVPSYLIHNPLMECLQIGATIRRIADSKLRQTDQEKQGTAAGVLGAALGLTEEVPFAREATDVSKVFDPQERQGAIGRLVQGLFVPAGVQWSAEKMDKDAQGNPVERKPQTVGQSIKAGIPGLRKQVPTKEDIAAQRKVIKQSSEYKADAKRRIAQRELSPQ